MISPPSRPLNRHYQDPLSVIWCECLRELGWRLQRSAEVFASWDGERTLTLGESDDLDPDDHLGQLILHEICHSIIEGESGRSTVDWGLDNTDTRHLVNELACHRLQALLADEFNLRSLMAVTTDWRPYFEAIPTSGLAPQSADELQRWASLFDCSIDRAQALDLEALELVTTALHESRNATHLRGARVALHRSAILAEVISPIAPPQSIWLK